MGETKRKGFEEIERRGGVSFDRGFQCAANNRKFLGDRSKCFGCCRNDWIPWKIGSHFPGCRWRNGRWMIVKRLLFKFSHFPRVFVPNVMRMFWRSEVSCLINFLRHSDSGFWVNFPDPSALNCGKYLNLSDFTFRLSSLLYNATLT